MNDTAVVLCSGGLDSCVTTAIAAENYDLALLHLNYGQLTEKRELKAFTDIADHYQVKKRLVIDIRYLAEIGGSALTDKTIAVPSNGIAEGIPVTYVPFRNANILAMAVSWAETLNAKKIYIGAVEEDSSGYPDCRESFFNAYNQMIKLGTKDSSDIEIVTPLIHLNKGEIVRLGISKNAPLQLSWSCYQAEELACAVCDSCRLRLNGFRQAGVPDPISYSIH
ncbi:MAG: 7-cyano-7-deazaguanine synthase QueC [Calditrichaeota bacterium]|nr:7-cyano-7-deazaguanine synthase QueC [Calditrichota bacterium]